MVGYALRATPTLSLILRVPNSIKHPLTTILIAPITSPTNEEIWTRMKMFWCGKIERNVIVFIEFSKSTVATGIVLKNNFLNFYNFVRSILC